MAKIRYGVCNAMVEVLNEEIESLPSEVLEQLDCGDFIIKVTGDQKHRYFVSYKEAGVGMCFTYADAGCVETISYDCVDGEWVFNSKDVSESKSDEAVKELAKEEVESAESGTIDNALGLDSEGNLVKGAISGGTKLYKHTITIAQYTNIEIISTSSNSITRLDSSAFETALKIEWKAGGAYSGYQIYNYEVKYTGGGSYDGFVLYFVKSTNDGTDVTNTYKFYTHDNSNVTDNVTPL